MGSSYTNVTVRHERVEDVVAALRSRGRSAFVSPPERGCVVVFDAVTEEQDAAELEWLALQLSKRLGCAALAVLVHDDDLLYYVLFESGNALRVRHEVGPVQIRQCCFAHEASYAHPVRPRTLPDALVLAVAFGKGHGVFGFRVTLPAFEV